MPDKQIYRNPIYRERRVRLELKPDFGPSPAWTTQQTSVMNALKGGINLTEVTSVTPQSNSGTAISMGVRKAVLQPWYFGPFTVTIQGKSYIGAYVDDRINYNKDSDVYGLIHYTQLVNNSFLQNSSALVGAPNRWSFLLTCYDPKQYRNFFGITTQYEGFFDDIQYVEEEGNPYILNYTIKFIGQIALINELEKGKAAGALDTAKAKAKNIINFDDQPNQTTASYTTNISPEGENQTILAKQVTTGK